MNNSSNGGKALVVYFTHSGNTRAAAKEIARQTGGDTLEVRAAGVYPSGYDAVVAVAKKEQQADARPALEAEAAGADLTAYDTVYLGFPNWWGTLPMPLFTFLQAHDFAGKTIRPFCTHEGSGMGRSERDIARLAPGATIAKGLAIRGSRASGAGQDIEAWLKQAE